MSSRSTRAVGAAVSAALTSMLLTGCGGGGSDTSFTVALIEPDITAVPLLAAVDAVREEGFDVTVEEAAEPELAIEGLVRGDYQFSAEATSSALIAISKGAPIRIVADVVGNQWSVYGSRDRDSCAELDGRPFGIFSEGAVATAMVRQWVSGDCPGGAEPEYLTIGDSGARAQALLAGQIDATALELTDIITLEAEGATGLYQMADFAEVFPGLHPQTVYASEGYLDEHREASQAFVDALVEEHRKINADPGYLASLALRYLPDAYDEQSAETVSRRYVEAGLFDAAGLTADNLRQTVDFFADAEVIDPMPVSDVADLSFLEGRTGERS
ncbi:ABC transporter substrate-binding protein [Streptomyces sp. 6N223]|uniref:ABC transporter substrate-binding protein n=1 Tax=Streptomyces sp. 6N223 TaxID=3457412 RepID=UPI003FCF609C